MTGIAKALQVIRENDVQSPKDFAVLMWPNSEGWQRIHKVGNGVHRGAMMAMTGGAFLGKLRQQGLIYNTRISLTDKGLERLRQEMPS